MGEENTGCPGLGHSLKDGNVKIYCKEPQQQPNKKSESYFLHVKVGSGKTTKDYFPLPGTQFELMGSSLTDLDDADGTLRWDVYEVLCPEGPPCQLLEELFSELR
jgi:hypothetical protein